MSSDVHETSLLILKTLYVEQGGWFLYMLWSVRARHSAQALYQFRRNWNRNKEFGLFWCFGNSRIGSDTDMCSGSLWGKELRGMANAISLVGMQDVEHFFPNFGDASLTLVKIDCSDETNWSQQSWARCLSPVFQLDLFIVNCCENFLRITRSQEEILHLELSLPLSITPCRWNRKLRNMYVNCF